MLKPNSYLAEGTKDPLDRSGLWMSRKLVRSVFLEDCALELPDESILSVPFSILVASCMANMISCILGLEELCCSTHWIATSAILHMDSTLTVPTSVGSMMLITSPLRINALAYERTTNYCYCYFFLKFETSESVFSLH